MNKITIETAKRLDATLPLLCHVTSSSPVQYWLPSGSCVELKLKMPWMTMEVMAHVQIQYNEWVCGGDKFNYIEHYIK